MADRSTPRTRARPRSPPTRGTAPPTHEGLPVIGNTHQLVLEQGGLYEDAAERGDVVELRILGFGEFYQVNHPDLAEHILVDDRDRFRKASLSRDDLGDLLGQGLVLSEGDLWERQRERIQPAFYMDQIADYADVMTAEARAAADEWGEKATVNVEREMKALTLGILVKAMFGSEIDYEAAGIPDIVAKLQEPGEPVKQPIARLVPKWVPIPMWRRYERGIREMEGLIEAFVDRRRAEGPETRDDLLSRLLTATDEAGETMSERLLRDELMTFLFAGHETTATALTFTWLLLAQHPDVERRLVDELEAVLDGDRATVADVPDLEYTEAVLREAMRLYPPVPSIPRETTEPLTLGGYSIPEGATVAPMQWTIHRDERFWDEPLTFDPDRFLGDEAERPDLAYFPFGAGPRRCIGQQFALVEGTLILATLARRYHPVLVSDPNVDLSVSITTRPLEPIELRVEPRE
ncbi:cytochrome P450 [Halopiger xanaduensis]|uniref:Unspecific monooxygenase n=1 Tax=Halopiger xanaduensis (strain DSM 18323 / JCM 14033 / SH-6) TaxID=797210 RepID=F8D539_HALXS|nr:cytochrome P450 [Halopiger xanaduensis]AEH36391.1 Unspecific monooxygenase [Halopiger xanaduensis SH-6]